jgi:hypothetical protein
MSVGVMKDYKLKLRDPHSSDTLGGAPGMISNFFLGIDCHDLIMMHYWVLGFDYQRTV